MVMQFCAEELSFRDEVRIFIKDNLPDDLAEKVRRGLHLGKDDYVYWQKKLNEQGWFAPHWPKELGGTEWSAAQHYIFQNEQVGGIALRSFPSGCAWWHR